MGLFDESDSSDDDRGGDRRDVGDGGEEEEDPLDAYMKSLDAAPDDAAGRGGEGGGGRLDVYAEDEATSHWEIESDIRKKSNGDGGGGASGGRLLPKRDDDGGEKGGEEDGDLASSSSRLLGRTAAAAREARSAMSDTFVRAGGSKKKNSKSDPSADGNSDNDDDDEFDNLQKVRERQQEMLHQEIDPLERVNHKSIAYDPFRRKFRSPRDTPAGRAWRVEHDVVCDPSGFDPVLGFGEDDVFPEELARAVAKAGYDAPTLVQSQTLSVALGGRDALITAATGSGKTLAYIWPMIVHINDQPHIVPGTDGPIGIVLTPTRELAKQVHKYAKTFVESIGGKAVEVAGGNRGTWELTKELRKGCEIVVSSPGRLIDMVKKKGTNLRRVTFLVLDEADRMLDMGFEKQIGSILENVRPDRQTLMLSATFGRRVERVARGWLRDPVRIAIGRTGASSEHVDSHVMVLPNRDAKIQWLMEMLPVLSPLGRCLVFVATRADCDALSQMVQNSPPFLAGGSCAAATIVSIHGDKDQRDRNRAISRLKASSRAVLIATDVAARGLDVPDVATVISFDAAKNIDAHVHRVGRAGRLRKEGTEHGRGAAYTLLTPKKDANFAASLAEAFDREGREVGPELAALCQRSGRYGGGRAKHSRVGLGFEGGGAASGVGAGTSRASYYGLPSGDLPAKKKSRWG